MTRTAIYHATPGHIVERPTWEAPVMQDYAWYYQFDEAYDAYTAHLATLRTIPCSLECRGLWKPGQVLVEGVDYRVVAAFLADGGGVEEYFAFPLPVKSEDDPAHNERLLNTWNLFVEHSRRGFSYLKPGHPLTLNDWHKIYENATVDFIAELQQKYIITKR